MVDVLFYRFDDKKDHLRILGEILRRLNAEQASLMLSKLEMCKQEISCLGLKLNKNGRKIDEKYSKSIAQSRRPHKLTELRSFFCLVN